MHAVYTINTENGNYVKYDYNTKQEEVIHEANEILCYGNWCGNGVDGVQVILKEEFPSLVNLVEPKLLFCGSPGLTVINPKSGPSAIAIDGRLIPNEHRVLCVIGHTCGYDNVRWLITSTLAIYVGRDSWVNDRWEHNIPDLRDDNVSKSNMYGGCIDVFRNDPELTHIVYRLNTCRTQGWTQLRGGRSWRHFNGEVSLESFVHIAEYISSPMVPLVTFGKIRLLRSSSNVDVLVNSETGEISKYYRGPQDCILGTDNFAINLLVTKLYKLDGSVTVIIGYNNFIKLDHDDDHLPKPKMTNTKSAKSS